LEVSNKVSYTQNVPKAGGNLKKSVFTLMYRSSHLCWTQLLYRWPRQCISCLAQPVSMVCFVSQYVCMSRI